ncbi:MAG: hypothetical protein ACXAAI_06040 [Promethearchaeota archaeon]|jgi:hypothetical protein
MALTGEKVGIPSADEAPMIVMARYKQPIAGILSILIVFIISLATWWIFFDPRWHNPLPLYEMEITAWATVIGGFGLIGVMWAIWFENWPYYNWFKKPWKVGIVGTAINGVIICLFVLVFLPLFISVYSGQNPNSYIAWFVGASIFGALSGSCFSFAVLWVAGTMYWPFFKIKQPKRGAIVWIIGNTITLIVWFLLFIPAGNPMASSEASAVKPITFFPSYAFSLGWTQWLIFFSLLTLMTFEYWPWSKLGKKQPYIGIIAFASCALLGLLISYFFPDIIAKNLFDPFFIAIGGTPPDAVTRFKGWYMMSITYAIFLICAVVLVSLFFDNWPKKFPQWKNFLFRFLLVIIIGTFSFIGYYLLSPFLFGDNINYWRMNPTPFVLWFLWIEILFAYVWRKWPIYRAI